MRVVIAGGGGIARELARGLNSFGKAQIVVIELDKLRCQELSAELDALVLHGDATHPEILEKARAREADALVACTGSDPINTVIAMLARQMGVERIIVKLNEVGLHAACKQIGVEEIIAPKIAAAAQTLSTLYGLHRLDFSLLARGGLQITELAVLRSGKLKDLDLPDDVLALAVLRGEEVMMPRGGTSIQEGDVLLLMSQSQQGLQKAVEALSG